MFRFGRLLLMLATESMRQAERRLPHTIMLLIEEYCP